MTVNLLNFDADGLTAFFAEHGEKPFRAKQLLRWMHRFGEPDFAAMTDIAKSLREKLGLLARITPPPLLSTDPSSSWTASSPEAVPVVWSRKACRRTLRA